MSEERTPTNWVDSFVIWLLVATGAAYLLQTLNVLPAGVSFFLVIALLALGGLLLWFVDWFLGYFGDESGRLFG